MSLRVQQVKVSAISDGGSLAMNDRSHVICSFCETGTTLSRVSRSLVDKLSRSNETYCRFCLRHNLTSRNNRHTLILTFRSIIGYYYYQFYRSKDAKRSLFHSQLQDFVRIHEQAGLANPVFRYDPDSFLWFVDFEKIGSTGRKIAIQEVNRNVINILSCFNLPQNIPGFKPSALYKKYSEAIDLFYSQRSRPEGKRILNPTLLNCGVFETKEIPLDKTKEFLPQDMMM